MAEYDATNLTRTDLASTQDVFKVDSVTLDSASNAKETEYAFPDASQQLGYYKKTPHLKKAIDALGMWVTGKGYEADETTQFTLDNIRGWGEDTFLNIVWNLIVQKKVFGDCFAEIIRGDSGRIINLKPLDTSKMKIIVDKKGMLKRYVLRSNHKEIKFKIEDIFHSSNDRIGDEIHGTSVIECVEWIITALEEAMRDYKVVLHRNRIPVRIIEVDHNKQSELNKVKAQVQAAVKETGGEILVIPKGTVEFKDNTIVIQDPTNWIRALENAFYLAVGVPRVILGGSSEGTEASAKVDYLTFEEVYNKEHKEFEADFWNQVGLRIKFNSPASLQQQQATSEAANTGQVGFQQNDTEASIERE